MITYITRSRNVGGLEINYTEYQVLLVDDAQFGPHTLNTAEPKVLEMVGTFTHERCAEGLRDQLNDALQHGLNYSRNEEWGQMIEAAHQSIDRLVDVGQRRLAESLDPLEANVDDSPHTFLDDYADAEAAALYRRHHNPPEDSNKI